MMTIEEVITRIGELRSKFGRCSDADYDKEQVIIRNTANLILEDDDLLAILQRARSDAEIVERLPKTADGKAIVLDQEVWLRRIDGHYQLGSEDVFPARIIDLTRNDISCLQPGSSVEIFVQPSKIYSTREAALAAKGA